MPNLYSNEDCIDKYTIKKNNIDFIPKVSVIIPVFNVEGYLRQCLESVVNQTLKNIEIICVDDGSTDNSLSILKEYAEKDNRLTLVSSEHIGTGKCRNIALSLVSGEYVGFVDPDDWIEDEYFEKLYSFSSDHTDIIFQTSRREVYVDEDREVVIGTPMGNNDYEFRFNIIHYSAHLWSKIFKRSFIRKFDLKNSFTKRSQDLLFTFPAVLLAQEIRCLNNAHYYYRKGHKSACTVGYTENDAKEVFTLFSQIEQKVEHFNQNLLPLVKYKKNLMLKKIYDSSDEQVKRIIRKSVRNLYEIDFDVSNNDSRKIVICNPAPNDVSKLWWGDYWLGLDLVQGLKAKGYEVSTEYADKSNCLRKKALVNITIRGIDRKVILGNSTINVLYIISHPEDVSLREIGQYDIIIVGSKKESTNLKQKGFVAYYLPQFTNLSRFFYEENNLFKTKLLFVGNAYSGIRPAVKYATKNNLPLSLYGKYWSKCVDEKYIKGEYINNNDLHKYYSNAEIILSDTNENMKARGFVPNRIYDATACKAFVISDYMPEIEEIYGDSIPMYKNEKEFCNLVHYYLIHPDERKIKAEKAYRITIKRYTNVVFSNNFNKILRNYLFFKRYINIISDYIFFPYNLAKLNFLNKHIPLEFLTNFQHTKSLSNEHELELEKEKNFQNLLKILMPVRIDIKNHGNKNNNLIITGKASKITTPNYYSDSEGVGYVIEYSQLSNKLKLKVVHDGVLKIKFKTQDKRIKGEKFPFLIDYNSIKINDKELLTQNISVWHDKPYFFEMHVKNEQEIVIDVTTNYHSFSADDLMKILNSFCPQSFSKLDLSQFQKICSLCRNNKNRNS